jgi:hypothetical protein
MTYSLSLIRSSGLIKTQVLKKFSSHLLIIYTALQKVPEARRAKHEECDVLFAHIETTNDAAQRSIWPFCKAVIYGTPATDILASPRQ